MSGNLFLTGRKFYRAGLRDAAHCIKEWSPPQLSAPDKSAWCPIRLTDMKVILLEEDKLANVSDGYARNYLLPKKLAVLATPEAIKQMGKRADANRQKREEQKKIMEELAEKLTSKEIIIKADAGEEGKLFGSVTTTDVAKAVLDTFGEELDKKKINLNEHIKMLGEYIASVKLHTDVVAHLKIRVEKK